MSVKYNVVQRGQPGKPNAPKKHYLSIQSTGRVTKREVAEMIAQISTISNADTMAMLEAFLTVVPRELAKGNIVELGDFGTFWLRSSSEGTDKPEDVRASQITGVLPRFNPGKEFKKILNGIEFKKL
jgi:predicted histone-like DNA-binding protein